MEVPGVSQTTRTSDKRASTETEQTGRDDPKRTSERVGVTGVLLT